MMGKWRALVPLLGALGCGAEKKLPEPKAEVGIFFGGQMQRAQRIEVPSARPPNLGFRVTIPRGAAPELRVQDIEFEIVKPGPSGRRVTKKGSLKIPEGQEQVDHVLSLEPPRKLGVWNVRVVLGEQVLADRALYLVSPAPTSP